MKKILILLALPLLFNSCLKDDEDKFSKSATERIEEAVKEAITVLQGAENGWRMELYPEGERIYGGYTLFLKFNADNTVVASSENFAAGKTESSYYSVVAESGPVLAFDTNNDIIHFYSSPTTGAELGIGTSNGGLEGDSDFIVMEASADFVKLKGRKTNNYAYLYPIEAGVNWKTELQSYQDAAAKMDLIYTRCVVDGVTYPIDWEMTLNNFSSRVFRISYTPAPGDDGSVSTGEVIKAPFVFTETGLKFYSPLKIGNVAVSEMTFKEDYYFENEDGSVKIYSPKPVRSNNRLTITPADITFSSATVNVTPSVATDYYYFDVYEKADLEGESDMAIIKSLISEMNSLVGTYTADFIVSALGKKGAASEIFEDLSSETDHVVIGFGIVATENVVLATTDLFKKEFTTEKAPELDEAYAAWLGTWTVTSTTSMKSAKPISFDVTFSTKVANTNFALTGWAISAYRDRFPAIATFDKETGYIMIQSYQEIGATGDGTVRYVALCRDKNVSGKYYYPVGGSYVGLIGAIMSDGKGKVIGNELTLTGDVEAEVVMMDQFVYNGSNYLGKYNPTADSGFTADDYPVGPFTLVKKSPAAAPVKGKAMLAGKFAAAADRNMKPAVPQLTSAPSFERRAVNANAVMLK